MRKILYILLLISLTATAQRNPHGIKGLGKKANIGASDVTAPTIQSANTTSTTTIQIVFSETVVPTTTGWAFTRNGSGNTINSLSGSGNIWNFTLATAMANGEALSWFYSTTGNTLDLSGNELAGGSGTVTNNINVTIPNPPTSAVVNDNVNTFSWTNSVGYASTDHEYSTNGGSSWTTATTNSIFVDNVNLLPGQVCVRVKPATGRSASTSLCNATAFTFTQTQSGDPTPVVTVNPASFGVSPANADNSSQLAAMTAAYKGAAANFVCFNFDLNPSWAGQTIKWTNNGWRDQVDSIKVIFSGKFQCTSADANDVAKQPINNSGALINYPNGNTFPYSTGGKKFNTVAAGQTTITLQEGAGFFAAGDRVLIGGYEDQTNGYPPNARFVEYKTVQSVSGSNVTFTTGLQHSYNQNWRDWPGMSPYTADQNHGKPRAWKLYQTSTGNPKGYSSFAWYVNCEFLRNPNTQSWATSPLRDICDYLRLDNVKSQDVWASENHFVLINGGTINIAEFDKYNGVVKCVGVNITGGTANPVIASVTASTGVDSLVLINCTLGNYAPISPRVAYIEGCTFVSRDCNPNIYPHPEGVWIQKLYLKNNSFSVANCGSFTGAHVRWDYSGGSFTSNGGNSSQVTFAATNTAAYKALGPGPIRSTGGITATVTDITYDGTNYIVALSGVSGGTPASGQTWQFNREQKVVDLGGNTSVQGKPIYTAIAAP